jgi:hypothetical protein
MSQLITMNLDRTSGLLVSSHHRPKVHAQGRHCLHPGCATILSIYNKGKYCGLHWEDDNGIKRRELKARG